MLSMPCIGCACHDQGLEASISDGLERRTKRDEVAEELLAEGREVFLVVVAIWVKSSSKWCVRGVGVVFWWPKEVENLGHLVVEAEIGGCCCGKTACAGEPGSFLLEVGELGRS